MSLHGQQGAPSKPGLFARARSALGATTLFHRTASDPLRDFCYERFRQLVGLFETLPAEIRNSEQGKLFKTRQEELEGWVHPRAREFERNDAADYVHNLHLLLLSIIPLPTLNYLMQGLRAEYREAAGEAVYNSYQTFKNTEEESCSEDAAKLEAITRADAIYVVKELRLQHLLKQHAESTRRNLIHEAFIGWRRKFYPLAAILFCYLLAQKAVDQVQQQRLARQPTTAAQAAAGETRLPPPYPGLTPALLRRAPHLYTPLSVAGLAWQIAEQEAPEIRRLAASEQRPAAPPPPAPAPRWWDWLDRLAPRQLAEEYFLATPGAIAFATTTGPPSGMPYTTCFQALIIGAFLALAGIAGASGGMLSVIHRIQNIAQNSETTRNLQLLSQSATPVRFAPTTGMISAIVLSIIFAGGLVSGSLFPKVEGQFWYFTLWQPAELAKWLVWAFLAGFSERLLPDIIDRFTNRTRSEGDTMLPPTTPSVTNRLPPGLEAQTAAASGAPPEAPVIERIDPPTVEAGQDTPLVIAGRGFSPENTEIAVEARIVPRSHRQVSATEIRLTLPAQLTAGKQSVALLLRNSPSGPVVARNIPLSPAGPASGAVG